MVPLFSAFAMAVVCLILPVTTAAPTDSADDTNAANMQQRSASTTDSPSSTSSSESVIEGLQVTEEQQPHVPLSNTEKLAKLTNLIKTFKLQDCAGRVLCDLNCQPVAFGSDGKRVLKMLVNIQTSGDMDKDDMRFYLNAAMTGRKTKFTHGDCKQCINAFPNCLSSSKDIIALASLLRLNH